MKTSMLKSTYYKHFEYGLYFDYYKIANGIDGWYYEEECGSMLLFDCQSLDCFINYVCGFVDDDDKNNLKWFIKEFDVLDYILNRLSDAHIAFLEKYGFKIKTYKYVDTY